MDINFDGQATTCNVLLQLVHINTQKIINKIMDGPTWLSAFHLRQPPAHYLDVSLLFAIAV